MWCDDPNELAELYRYLELRGEAPADPAYFMEKGHKWSEEYKDLQRLRALEELVSP